MKCPYCEYGDIDLWDTGFKFILCHLDIDGGLCPCDNGKKWSKLFSQEGIEELNKNYEKIKRSKP